MKNLYRYFYVSLLITIALTSGAFADVKVKSKQTASGQTYEHTTYIKGKRQRTEQNMGSMQTINLTQCDLKRFVQINPASKTYIINLFNQAVEATSQNVSANSKDGVVRAGGTVTSTVTYKDTGEKKKMFGYDARRIITTMETASSPDACSPHNSKMQIDGWYIVAAFALDCDWGTNAGYGAKQKNGCQDKYQMKTIGNAKRGFPVYEKMTMFDESGKEIMSSVTEVVELSQATLDASLFEIPADYREAKDMNEFYGISNANYNSNSNSQSSNPSNSSATVANIKNQAQAKTDASSTVGAKKAGVVRIGLTSVKVGAVGEHLTAADLAAAIENTLGEYLKGTNIEVVQLEAKLSSAVESEARQKECDYILNATVSHKKGGGGFGGMLGSMVAQSVSSVGYGTGSRVGSVVGQVAAQTIITASAMSARVKSKDEITLEVKMNAPGNSAAVLTKQAKAKAKSDGEDIITPVVEQIAQAIFNAIAK